jgi:mono/diheme cytochrome c family protein
MTISLRRFTGRVGVAAGAVGVLAVLGVVHAQQGNSRPADRSSAQAQAPIHRNDDLQPAVLPPLPAGMTLEMIQDGDRVFHGEGGCFVCHGIEAQGMPAAGDAITTGVAFIPLTWPAIDSLVTAGMPDAMTRSPIAMPSRGAKGNLSREDVESVAAYVWAIAKARGEPWPGGHESHVKLVVAPASTNTSNDIGAAQRRP